MYKEHSQKVLRDSFCRFVLFLFVRWLILVIVVFQIVVDLEYRALIPTTIAVVRRREHRHTLLTMRVVISLHNQLMRPTDHLQVVLVMELVSYILTPTITSSSRGWTESTPTLICRIRPEQVAKRSIVRDVLNTVDGADLVDGVDLRGQAAVETEYLVFDNSSYRQHLKDISKHLPHLLRTILMETLIIKPIQFVYLPILMITSQQRYPILIHNLQDQHI